MSNEWELVIASLKHDFSNPKTCSILTKEKKNYQATTAKNDFSF